MISSYSISVKGPNCVWQIPVYKTNTLVVGSGAASLNCAHTLSVLGQKNVLLVTEGMAMGTSRNTGSDKQTYYKISTVTSKPDSAQAMAEELFACGSMHGDIALVEAIGSLRSFFKLVSLGVPFPHSSLGEYCGYQTDHDASCRATSCGPLTSKYMTETLQKAVEEAHIPVADGYRIIEILTQETAEGKKQAIGAVGYNADLADQTNGGLAVFAATNIVWGVGGPSSVYATSVYPESQTCALGTAYLAGVRGTNITESQYGIASLSFRWNLSGSYQQVLPRYFSVDADGKDEQEFLSNVFSNHVDEEKAVFRKGYEWPFDPYKLNHGATSSLVDLAVFCENAKGRKVYMDFRKNNSKLTELTPDTIGTDAFDYLKNSYSLQATPIQRLRAMNEQAYQLYLAHGIDLEKEPLEIGVCAQHCNGGLENSVWFESPTLAHFFPVGEAGGSFGIRRPGGSALNDTQVSSTRAAERIAAIYRDEPQTIDAAKLNISVKLRSLLKPNGATRGTILERRKENGLIMDRSGAFLRNLNSAEKAYQTLNDKITQFFSTESANDARGLQELCINYDSLVTAATMLAAIVEYIRHGGQSRGSYVITDLSPTALLKDQTKVVLDTQLSSVVENVSVSMDAEGRLSHAFDWVPVRPIPQENNWFETIMNAYIKGEIYN